MAESEAKTPDSPTIGRRIDDAIEHTRARLGEATGRVREQIEHGREVIEGLRNKTAGDVVTSVKEFAKEHPGTTLLGGMALGFLIGYFVRRRD